MGRSIMEIGSAVILWEYEELGVYVLDKVFWKWQLWPYLNKPFSLYPIVYTFLYD